MKGTCPISPIGTQTPDAGGAPQLAGNTPPVDQHEMDRKAAHQLLPAILRLATRRLGASQGVAADAPSGPEEP